MTAPAIDVEDLIQLIRQTWPARYERGRILHVHRNALRLPSGAIVHLRVLVQYISEAEAALHQTENKE